MALTLAQLLAHVNDAQTRGNLDLPIEKITADSRQTGPGVLFIAVKGTAGDGHDYLSQVQAAGCQAVVVEEATVSSDHASTLDGFGAVVTVPSSRPLPAILARTFAGNPDLRLVTAGVTGTNGKTTVSYLLRQMLGHVSRNWANDGQPDLKPGPCGLLGTISYEDGKETIPAPLTTPGGIVFYDWLGRMVSNGCSSVAMEISSHALDQGRTAGLGLDVAIMTNLGRDHLDYHNDLQEYLQAKGKILELLRPEGQGPLGKAGVAVINGEDDQLQSLVQGCQNVVLFSAQPDSTKSCDLQVESLSLSLSGTRLQLVWRGQKLELASLLVGSYNVENLTAALAAGLALGLDPKVCIDALADIDQVPGRMERVALPTGAIAVVDYAHTHDALAAVLAACDELVEGRLIAVFGCGGDRDTGKRPLMGEVAAKCSDLVWITSDNPRSENPAAICSHIEAGYKAVKSPRSNSCRVVVDRTAGIRAALEATQSGDIVVVAGKGHEDYQLIGDQRLDLDDRQIIRDWVSERTSNEL